MTRKTFLQKQNERREYKRYVEQSNHKYTIDDVLKLMEIKSMQGVFSNIDPKELGATYERVEE